MADDFGIFADSQHMFFNLREPFAFIRESLESMLRSSVPDTDVHAIRAFGEPKWLTLGRKADDDPGKMIVTSYAFCFRATIEVETPRASETLDATFTACFADIDQPGEERTRTWIDLHDDASKCFDDEALKERFLTMRYVE